MLEILSKEIIQCYNFMVLVIDFSHLEGYIICALNVSCVSWDTTNGYVEFYKIVVIGWPEMESFFGFGDVLNCWNGEVIIECII